MRITNTIITVLLAQTPQIWAQTENYDPLKIEGRATVSDTQFTYGEDERVVPLRIFLPESRSAAPVVLFSHGLGGSKENSKYLGNHWAGRGYAVVLMQHAGSDINVIRDAPRLKKMAAIKAAASGKNAIKRYRDVKETLNHLESINVSSTMYAKRFDLKRVGMSGHSFGAVTTQAVSGQNYGSQGQVFTDKRINAAVAFSPSPPTHGTDSDAFGKVRIPWLLMTGTKDGSPIASRTDATSRRLVFKQLPQTDMFYELVFEGGEHSAFSDHVKRGQKTRNPKPQTPSRHPGNQHRILGHFFIGRSTCKRMAEWRWAQTNSSRR